MAKDTYTNHPAYPVHPYPGDQNNPLVRPNSGMSMRDYFAAQALAGLDLSDLTEFQIASICWGIADEMMRQRSEKK